MASAARSLADMARTFADDDFGAPTTKNIGGGGDPEIADGNEFVEDNEPVISLEVNGEARAYPVNYMNGPLNEVVNDTLGGAHIAPTW